MFGGAHLATRGCPNASLTFVRPIQTEMTAWTLDFRTRVNERLCYTRARSISSYDQHRYDGIHDCTILRYILANAELPSFKCMRNSSQKRRA